MPDKREQLSDLLDRKQADQERLFSLVASLANLLDKDRVVETVTSILGIQPVYDGDCVVFDDLAIRFDRDGRVTGIFRTIDGSGLPLD